MGDGLAFHIETGGGIRKSWFVVRFQLNRTTKSAWPSRRSVGGRSICGDRGGHGYGLNPLRHEFFGSDISDFPSELDLVVGHFARVIDPHLIVLKLVQLHER